MITQFLLHHFLIIFFFINFINIVHSYNEIFLENTFRFKTVGELDIWHYFNKIFFSFSFYPANMVKVFRSLQHLLHLLRSSFYKKKAYPQISLITWACVYQFPWTRLELNFWLLWFGRWYIFFCQNFDLWSSC